MFVVFDYHFYSQQKDTQKCLVCVGQRSLIGVMVNGINELTLKDKLLKKRTLCYANSNMSCFTWPKSETDAKMNFYTGIQTIEIFNVLFT